MPSSKKRKGPETTPKKAKKTKKSPPAHPPYREMVIEAFNQLKGGRKGSSRQALKKWILGSYKVNMSFFSHNFKQALNRGVEEGEFLQVNQARFKLNKQYGNTKSRHRDNLSSSVVAKLSYLDFAGLAILYLKETRKGSTRKSIGDWIVENFTLSDRYYQYVKQALRRGVENGDLNQPNQSRFKLSESFKEKMLSLAKELYAEGSLREKYG